MFDVGWKDAHSDSGQQSHMKQFSFCLPFMFHSCSKSAWHWLTSALDLSPCVLIDFWSHKKASSDLSSFRKSEGQWFLLKGIGLSDVRGLYFFKYKPSPSLCCLKILPSLSNLLLFFDFLAFSGCVYLNEGKIKKKTKMKMKKKTQLFPN